MRNLKIEAKITPRHMRGVEIYLNNLTRIPMVSPEDEVEIAMKIKNGNHLAAQQLINANLRFVVSVAKQYQGYCNNFISLLDLVQAGNEGLVEAAYKFDPTRGFKFISYAVWYIRQRIQVYVNTTKTPVRLPLNIITNNRKAMVIQEKFNGENINDIAEQLEAVGRTFQVSVSSFDRPIAHDSDIQVWETTTQTTEPQPDAFEETEHTATVIKLLMERLNEKNRKIIGHTFGVFGYQQLRVEDIAEMFESTPTSIKTITRTILKNMQRHAKTNRYAN